MKPPYATQIIVQTDGSIMLKYELARKQDIADMLAQALMELSDSVTGGAIPQPLAPPPSPVLGNQTIPTEAKKPVVVPDTGVEPPMRVLSSVGVTTLATCNECGASGSPSSLVHLPSCSSFDVKATEAESRLNARDGVLSFPATDSSGTNET